MILTWTKWDRFSECLYRWHAYKLIGQTIFQTDSMPSVTRIFVPLTRVQPSRTCKDCPGRVEEPHLDRSGRLYACQRYKDSRFWGYRVRLENSLSNKLVRVPTVQTSQICSKMDTKRVASLEISKTVHFSCLCTVHSRTLFKSARKGRQTCLNSRKPSRKSLGKSQNWQKSNQTTKRTLKTSSGSAKNPTNEENSG